MKFMAILLLLSFSALAQTTNDKLIKKLEAIDIGGNGSECSLSKYDVNKFDYTQAVKAFYKDHSEDEDVVLLKWDEVINLAKNYTNDEWMNTFRKLQKNKQIKAMFGSGIDEEICTESEYCLRGSVKIYFKTGQQLSCYFDWTT